MSEASGNMNPYLETTVDKFTFKVATDRFYAAEGVWVLAEGDGTVRLGISDFVQQVSGDVTFANVRPAGTSLAVGDTFATLETFKVISDLSSAVAGTIVETNPALALTPEVVNQDPYGAGWLARLDAPDLAAARRHLLDPQAYFAVMKRQAEEEAKKP
jgi:glycine cleavage system H protein